MRIDVGISDVNFEHIIIVEPEVESLGTYTQHIKYISCLLNLSAYFHENTITTSMFVQRTIAISVRNSFP